MNSKTRYGLLAASGVALALAFKSARRPARTMRGDVVLITGGSRGLGLRLAEEFALLDCSIAICARDSAELERAGEVLESKGARVMTVVCDVADEGQVAAMIHQVRNRFGRIDTLVNNAGVISVGPLENMSKADFEDAMNVMFWGVVHCSLAVLPEMIERGAGRIATITSVAGKVSVPPLLPYSCAKHAAVAFSEGLRSEVSQYGVSVSTIAPGLMRTGSHRQAQFKGQHKKEALWFMLGATLPLVSMDVSRAARQIVRAVQNGKAEKILSWQASLLSRTHGAFPGIVSEILSLVNRVLPGKGQSSEIVNGATIEDSAGPLFRALTSLGRVAGEQLNERPVS
ncbi:MAG: SDR family NAD(P)-dependent oxidoreductase [Bryobacteraceae bacterium]